MVLLDELELRSLLLEDEVVLTEELELVIVLLELNDDSLLDRLVEVALLDDEEVVTLLLEVLLALLDEEVVPLLLDVGLLDDEAVADATVQAPVTEGTALTPEPMGIIFDPQFAAGAMCKLSLSWSYTTSQYSISIFIDIKQDCERLTIRTPQHCITKHPIHTRC